MDGGERTWAYGHAQTLICDGCSLSRSDPSPNSSQQSPTWFSVATYIQDRGLCWVGEVQLGNGETYLAFLGHGIGTCGQVLHLSSQLPQGVSELHNYFRVN